MAGERVPYHLRQNKHVERELFLDLLGKIGRKVKWKNYLYVGFGGPFFEDFKLMHQRLGIKKMLSLELSQHVYLRQKINIPYGCVKRENISSGDFIQNIGKIKRQFRPARSFLIWLDYADARQLSSQMDEVRALLPKLSRNDIVKVTLNANPGTLGDLPPAEQSGTDQRERRLALRKEKLRQRLGAMFPANATDEDLTPDRYPGLLLSALKIQVAEAMKENPDLAFQPIGCFVYADSQHSMLTCTGILLRHAELTRYASGTGLREYEFASLGWELHKIDVPYLSAREKLLLDNLLFEKQAVDIVNQDGMWFSDNEGDAAKMIDDYFRFYRFYPHYHRIQY